MDHDGTDPRGPKTRHVVGEGGLELGAAHRGAAVLDHHAPTAPLIQMMERAQGERGVMRGEGIRDLF